MINIINARSLFHLVCVLSMFLIFAGTSQIDLASAQDDESESNLLGINRPVLRHNDWYPFIEEYSQQITVSNGNISITLPLVLVPQGGLSIGAAPLTADDIDEQVIGGNTDDRRRNFGPDDIFYIMTHEVTNQMASQLGSPLEPVRGVTWGEAHEICRSWGGNLPSEVQWEYAARGPNPDFLYPWGPNPNLYPLSSEILPADQNTGDISWVGAKHMLGNVAEWTSSKYQPYPIMAIVDIEGRENPEDTGGSRTVRGGNYNTPVPIVSVLTRFAFPAGASSPFIGFRCVFPYPLTLTDVN